MKNLSCPICKIEIYSELGKGCKMCGMALKDESKEFCSRACKKKYKKINFKLISY
ncbi:MAG: hypothetical protein ABIH72_03965 [archaeon]